MTTEGKKWFRLAVMQNPVLKSPSFLAVLLAAVMACMLSVVPVSGQTALGVYQPNVAVALGETAPKSLNVLGIFLDVKRAALGCCNGADTIVDVPKGLTDPSKIRFSQDSIKGTFRDGQSIDDLVKGLKDGSIKPGDVPAIRVVEKNGQLISIDNRRLAAFRQAGVPIRTRPATAKEISEAQLNGKFSAGSSGGDTIRIRGQ